jgi:ATP-binding cassette subfamily B protein
MSSPEIINIEKLKNPFKILSHLKDAVALVWESGPGWVLASAILVVAQGLLPLASLYLMKLVVDGIAAALSGAGAERVFHRIGFLILMMGLVSLATTLFSGLSRIVSEIQSQTTGDRIFDILHAKSIALDLEYYENPKYYDIYYRAQQEAPYRPMLIVSGIIQLGQNAISLTAIGGLLLTFHWSLALVLVIAVLPGIYARLKYSDQVYRWESLRSQAERQTHYFHWILTGDAYARELRLFDFGNLFKKRFQELRQVLRKERLSLSIRHSLVEMVYQVFSVLAVFGTLVFIVSHVIKGAMTLGDFVMFYQALFRCQNYLRDVLRNLADLYEHSLFLSHYHAFIELPPKITAPARPAPIHRPIQQGIAFEHVGFRYPSSSRDVLQDIHFHIKPGEHVAFVGENGEGKTTLIKLLCRLYDPQEGRVTIDGVDLREFDPVEFRGEISVIFQDYVKYHLSAGENIWLGNVNHPYDPEQVAAAARASGADKLIQSLPQGYDTMMGKMFRQGEELSVGEWQKIALARAFMRKSQIMILDEPTSALDPGAEAEALRQFRDMARGRTTIFISHRLSMARLADRIVVLKDGRIAEDGPHDDLIRQKGHYARLFEIQAENYQ